MLCGVFSIIVLCVHAFVRLVVGDKAYTHLLLFV